MLHFFFTLRQCARSLMLASACAGAVVSTTVSASDAPAGFNTTAHVKTSNTILYADKTYGLTRAGAQGLIDQCNSLRSLHYNLPPVSPPESILASLDVRIRDKYLDSNKALTSTVGNNMDVLDTRRWMSEYARTAPAGQVPATPPNCALFKLAETRSDTLWRDGLVYELRYNTRKAIAKRAAAVSGPNPKMAVAFSSARPERVSGESCREIVGGEELPGDGHACFWDLFPYLSYLNWPFALNGRVQFGPVRGMVETIVPITVEHGRSIPASVFEIPTGFTVVGP